MKVKPLYLKRLTKKRYSNKNTSLKPSAVILSKKDIPSSRLLFRLVPSKHRTVGTESSLLPTVQTQGLKVCNEKGKTEFIDLKLLPTPNAREADKYSKKYNPKSQMGTALAALAMNGMLPTPTANSWKTPCEHGTGSPDLQTYIARELGPTSRLNPLFVEEMMGFPLMWCALPFLSQRGVPDQSKDTETL